ncbi:IclR family transcriptional regulator [Palleronia abyssalis]|uniref:Transcriptional regulator KdgR n=1 Tax=Palleronia abyssalis TaxID=1501240 RepID=A0A2R8C057_9RHOB|nr:IclR family transcriptional regulator [Palleronia abyssalis]SPJ25795.1 Transcriptional regulator KdgR [Palleronia abyssalis]
MARDAEDVEKPAVPAVARAAALLDLVAAEPDRLGLTDLADRLGLAKSSIHALTRTLVESGVLERTPRQTFVVGPRVMRWATAFSKRSDVATEFARIWDEGTVRLQGATITLSTLDGNDVVYIGARNSENTPWFNFRVGMRLPMAFTATGQAFMSRMSDAEIRYRLRDGLPEPLTPRSPQTVEDVLALVAQTRDRGYSLDLEYVSEGMVCFGAPVLGAANKPAAGVAVSLPAAERTPQTDERVVATLIRMARTISERMGAVLEDQSNLD